MNIIEYLQIINSRMSAQNKVQLIIIAGLCLEYFNFKINLLEKQIELQLQEDALQELEKQQENIGFKLELKGNKIQLVRSESQIEMRLRKQNEEQYNQNNNSNSNQTANLKSSGESISELKRQSSSQNQQQNVAKQQDKLQKLKKLKKDYSQFLKINNSSINEEILYEITQNHGRIDDCLNYAKEQNNYENVITHYVNEQNYKEAVSYLKVLAKKDPKRATEMVYKFSYILLQQVPKEFVSLVLNSIKDFQPSKLISGLMNISSIQRTNGIEFLEYCVYKQRNSDKIIHNLYLFFLANSIHSENTQNNMKVDEDAHSKLMEYLNKAEELENESIYDNQLNDDEFHLYSRNSKNSMSRSQNIIINFDLDFALHLFEQKNITEAMIKIYALMNFYDLAVKIALDKNNINLAKEYASKPNHEDQKHKLWLKIAVHLIQTQQSQNVLQLTRDSGGYLKVEDLLPHFGEVHSIDLLKEQICKNLEDYNNEIESIKNEMVQLNGMSDTLKKEINNHSHQSLQIKGEQDCAICHKSLLSQDHYFYNCFHGFHRNCYIQRMQSDRYILEQNKINDDQNIQILSYTQNNTFNKILAFNQHLNKVQQDLKIKEEDDIKQLKQQVIDEQLNQQSSSISKFFKGIGGAFIGGGNKKDDEQQFDINQFKKKLNSMSNLQIKIQQFLSKEEREEYYKKQQKVDEYLSKECYFCGFSSVDRIHTFYQKETKPNENWLI